MRAFRGETFGECAAAEERRVVWPPNVRTPSAGRRGTGAMCPTAQATRASMGCTIRRGVVRNGTCICSEKGTNKVSIVVVVVNIIIMIIISIIVVHV
jgi:hypothetical protein